ncbi:Cloroperoxidase [Russula earlei]|uniref:Cloroperoxidase n=1 Tax=Russula earlei TaxID=71964 RepID=A0ACC0UPW7_9AGAM|nr:Cloroperoxidase [Russula earlei]
MSDPKHDYIPPSVGDSRSPCPALNALANHSYLPHNGKDISVFQLIRVLREHYHISLPLAVFLSLGGTFFCGRYFKIDLQDLARHNLIEHDASLTRANAYPDCRYAPVAVDRRLLQLLLGVSQNPHCITSKDLVKVRAMRDKTLDTPLSKLHGIIARGEVALTIQTLRGADGNISKKFIQEWFGDERLPIGWSKPTTPIGLRSTTRLANWVWSLLKGRRVD